jgi:transketolase
VKQVIASKNIQIDQRSQYLRSLVIRGLIGGNRGHIGASMSPIEILRVLYDEVMSYDPKNPRWIERDRCVLSKGHGCLAIYALLADKGFFDVSHLDKFCQFDGILGGHPEFGKVPGIEASTGSLGHGFSIGVGMALSAKMRESASHVFVIMGDGEINEGSVWEAALSASKHKLNNLTAIIDYNKIQSAGFTKDILDMEPLADKWTSFGFDTCQINGHDINELSVALSKTRQKSEKPRAVICHTVKGKGIGFAENNPEWHHHAKFDANILSKMYKSLES